MSLTDDPKDPGLGRGVDDKPVPQNEKYLVLSAEERAKGFVRPVRRAYVHVGISGPKNPTRDLTEEEKQRFGHAGYVKFEIYPESESPATGRFWTQAQLDSIGKGCGTLTTMALANRRDVCAQAVVLRRDLLLRLHAAQAGRRGRRVRLGRHQRKGRHIGAARLPG